MKITCPFCYREVRDIRAKGVFVEQTGWSVIREGGGANQLSLRKETGRYAHENCVRLAVKGIDPANQGSLL